MHNNYNSGLDRIKALGLLNKHFNMSMDNTYFLECACVLDFIWVWCETLSSIHESIFLPPYIPFPHFMQCQTLPACGCNPNLVFTLFPVGRLFYYLFTLPLLSFLPKVPPGHVTDFSAIALWAISFSTYSRWLTSCSEEAPHIFVSMLTLASGYFPFLSWRSLDFLFLYCCCLFSTVSFGAIVMTVLGQEINIKW